MEKEIHRIGEIIEVSGQKFKLYEGHSGCRQCCAFCHGSINCVAPIEVEEYCNKIFMTGDEGVHWEKLKSAVNNDISLRI